MLIPTPINPHTHWEAPFSPGVGFQVFQFLECADITPKHLQALLLPGSPDVSKIIEHGMLLAFREAWLHDKKFEPPNDYPGISSNGASNDGTKFICILRAPEVEL